MFTIDQIKEAHSKVKSGADFPNYIQDLIKLGVRGYSTFVKDGHAEYFGENKYTTQSESKYAALEVANKSDQEKFLHYLKIHQQGQSNFMTFCNQAAETGIEKWTVAMDKMTCTYYNKAGETILVETIPTVK